MTRRQKALEDAQQRAHELGDRENTLALKSLSKKEPKRDGLKEGNLRILFEDKEVDGDMGEKNSDGDSDVDTGEGKLPPNILDRNKNQLIEDQQSDVTLYKVRNAAADKAPMEADGYFIDRGLLMYRKFYEDMHNGASYVELIAVPESYRNKFLLVGHTIPLSGHMGSSKTLSRVATISFGLGFTLMSVSIVQPVDSVS